tara:strand:+ start:191 stop:406 length:216 start_codon:yes stop_codon:yes gene_type:complete
VAVTTALLTNQETVTSSLFKNIEIMGKFRVRRWYENNKYGKENRKQSRRNSDDNSSNSNNNNSKLRWIEKN